MSDGEVGVWRKTGGLPPEFERDDQGPERWKPQQEPDWNRWKKDGKPKRRFSWWPFGKDKKKTPPQR
jgi:hypothetical protein